MLEREVSQVQQSKDLAEPAESLFTRILNHERQLFNNVAEGKATVGQCIEIGAQAIALSGLAISGASMAQKMIGIGRLVESKPNAFISLGGDLSAIKNLEA